MLLTLAKLCTTADCSSTTSTPALPAASARCLRKFQIAYAAVMAAPPPPIIEGAMILRSVATCLACRAGSAGIKAVGTAKQVGPVLWVEKGLPSSASGRITIVSFSAKMVWAVVGLLVVDEASSKSVPRVVVFFVLSFCLGDFEDNLNILPVDSTLVALTLIG